MVYVGHFRWYLAWCRSGEGGGVLLFSLSIFTGFRIPKHDVTVPTCSRTACVTFNEREWCLYLVHYNRCWNRSLPGPTFPHLINTAILKILLVTKKSWITELRNFFFSILDCTFPTLLVDLVAAVPRITFMACWPHCTHLTSLYFIWFTK